VRGDGGGACAAGGGGRSGAHVGGGVTGGGCTCAGSEGRGGAGVGRGEDDGGAGGGLRRRDPAAWRRRMQSIEKMAKS